MTLTKTTALLAALGAAVVAAFALAGGEDARGAATATAKAEAFSRSGSTGESGRISIDGTGSKAGDGTSVSASIDGGRGTADSTASVGRVNVFGGLVTAGPVAVTATASAKGTTLSGSVQGLAVEGQPVGSFTSAASHDLNGYGTVQVLGSDGSGITALRVTLTKDYKGHPAGSTMAVAYASAAATDGAVPSDEPSGTTSEPAEKPERGQPRKRREPAAERSADDGGAAEEAEATEGAPTGERAERRRAPSLDALPTGRGYVFPVYGASGYSNDWGAPRQHTGTHEGTDVFAPTGTPVLAVTGGRLYRVGTREVPGNRMWLRSPDGDTFFYGHLAAFAHDARNGKRVRPGDVIGFVGSTGDAELTPPHLHFEIHPQDGEAVNPYPFLRAWEARRDVPQAAWLARYGNDPGSRPGALVVLEDWLERR
ncbi:MAG: M23 family metallopeptidase [Thermoleophilaceae bacterium]